MSVQKSVQTAQARPVAAINPSVAYHSAERALLRNVELRSMTAIDQMFAYYGADLA